MGKSLGAIGGVGLSLAGIASGTKWFTSAFFKQAGFLGLGLLAQSSQKTKVGALQDQGIMVAAEGVEIVRGFGTNRHSGTLVWTTNWIEHDTSSGGSGGPQTTNATYTTSCWLLGGQGPVTRLNRVWLNATLIYDWQSPPPTMVLVFDPDAGFWYGSFNGWELRFYPGTLTQPVDENIINYEGTGNWTNYPGMWGIYIQDLQGNWCGNSMPNITVEYYNAASSLQEVITEICERCGLLASDLDLFALGTLDTAPVTGEGFLIGAQKTGAEALQELETMFNFVLVEEDGVLRAKLRGQVLAATLTATDLRQHAGNDPTPGIQAAVADVMELPWSQEVQFMDVDRMENPGFRFFSRGDVDVEAPIGGAIPVRGLARDNATIASAMEGNRAQRIAKIALGEKWTGRRTYPIAWGMKYCYLGAGDEISIPTPAGITKRVHLPKITYPLFGANTCVAAEIDPLLYTIPLPSATSGLSGPTVVSLGDLLFVAWDGNSIQDADNGAPGAYFAVSKLQTAPWNAVGVYSNLTNAQLNGGPSNFQNVPQATIGSTIGTLGNYSGGYFSFDHENTITVDLAYGELESVTCDTLLDGVTNGCLIGAEYLQFAKATLVPNPDDPAGLWGGYSRYQLCDLIRGCRGTGQQIPLHGENESFVLLNAAIRRFTVALAVIGYPVSFTMTDSGGGGSASANATLTITGANLLTYAPICLTAIKDQTTGAPTSGQIVFTWTRRSRYCDTYYTTGQDVQLGEGSLAEQYELDILDGSIQAWSSSPYAPTTAFQVADQIATLGHEVERGDTLTYELYQIGYPQNRGYGNLGTVVVG